MRRITILLTLLTIFCSLLTLTSNSLLAESTTTTSSPPASNTMSEQLLTDANGTIATNQKVMEDDDDVDFSVTTLLVADGRVANPQHRAGELESFKVSVFADGEMAEHNTYNGSINIARNNVHITNVKLITSGKSLESLSTFRGSFPLTGNLVAGKSYTISIEYQVGLGGRLQTKNVTLLIPRSAKVATADVSMIRNTQVFPNPFTNYSTISYNLEQDSQVSVSIYNNTGQLIRTIIDNEYQTKGRQTIAWSSDHWSLPQGIYHCNIQTENQLYSIRIMKVK